MHPYQVGRMSTLNELIEQIENPDLRARVKAEVSRLNKQKKFGLVFEEHLPECTPLYEIPVKKGSTVALKTGKVNETYTVLCIDDGEAVCERQDNHEKARFQINELVCVAKFGEPIYPYLAPIDSVCNAPDSSLWHTLIEADNFHALQLLVYLYGGKVDCIYIDPPYNTGAKDWKYNNDYVDSSDSYRHSKWLSMMQKRLNLAKKLLNPNDSVLIVTIDEKEYLHLGCLLEEMFPEARIQMVATQITPQGNPRNQQFYRTDEYIFFVEFGKAEALSLPLDECWRTGTGEKTHKNINWPSLLRTGSERKRVDRPQMFYPFFVKNTDSGPIIDSVGDAYDGDDFENVMCPKDTVAVWPKGRDGELRRWQISASLSRSLIKEGFLRLGKWKGSETAVQYLAETNRENIKNGVIPIIGRKYDGSLQIDETHIAAFIPGTLWKIPSHDATRFGAQLLSKIIGDRFPFPKSLYAVHDAIRFFVADKPNALIVDFFAGSGTTLHAVNLLNAEDGGARRCIMVTNNEIKAEEQDDFLKKGMKPGDSEWISRGIARYVTWPRTVCSICGVDVNGNSLEGEYFTTEQKIIETKRAVKQISIDATNTELKKQIVSFIHDSNLPQKLVSENEHFVVSEDSENAILFDVDSVDDFFDAIDDSVETIYVVTSNKKKFKEIKQIVAEMPPLQKNEQIKRPMSAGFKANVAFFHLGFLDKNAVAVGRQFKELLPLLWMKAGAVGPCPKLAMNKPLPEYLILPENKFAVLIDENAFHPFAKELAKFSDIDFAYIVTDSERGYRQMISKLNIETTYQLYRDYLDNFRINKAR